MKTHILRKMALAIAGTVAVGLCTSSANAAEALWISAPTWSYSGAVASTDFGTFYAWYLSLGAGSSSFAYAFSVSAARPGAAYAFAAASAGNGGVAAVDVGGFADPYADVGVGISLDPTGLATEPGSLTFPAGYTVSDTGITFPSNDENGGELNGDEKIEAFVYTGGDSDSALQSELGITSDNNGATPSSSGGEVDAFSGLGGDFIPLDNPFDDTNGLSGITFTENTADIINDVNGNPMNIILVGEADAASTPTPAALPAGLVLLGLGGLVSSCRKRRIA